MSVRNATLPCGQNYRNVRNAVCLLSKPRYKWWSYVKGMIRAYPDLRARYRELKEVSITSQWSDTPHGTRISDSTAEAALRQLSYTEQKEYEAVDRAIRITERMKAGKERIEVVRLVLWEQTHTINGAAIQIHVSERTAWQYHREFIYLVAREYGLIGEKGNE